MPYLAKEFIIFKNDKRNIWNILGGLDSTGMPFDSVEAWDVMTDEVIELEDSPYFLPIDAADFTFLELDDYKVE